MMRLPFAQRAVGQSKSLPRRSKARKSSKKIPSAAIRRSGDIYWPDLKEKRATPVYDGERLESGNTVRGPAIVETADTTVVVQPGATLRLERSAISS